MTRIRHVYGYIIRPCPTPGVYQEAYVNTSTTTVVET